MVLVAGGPVSCRGSSRRRRSSVVGGGSGRARPSVRLLVLISLRSRLPLLTKRLLNAASPMNAQCSRRPAQEEEEVQEEDHVRIASTAGDIKDVAWAFST